MRYECNMHGIDDAGDADMLTTAEVADLCRVSNSTVTRWLADGRLPGVKVGPRTFRFRRSDVEALLTPDPT